MDSTTGVFEHKNCCRKNERLIVRIPAERKSGPGGDPGPERSCRYLWLSSPGRRQGKTWRGPR